MKHRYLMPIQGGQLFFVRVPAEGVRWKDILKALTVVMKSYGMKQKDVHEIEGYDPNDDDDAKIIARLDKAYAWPDDRSRFAEFELWDMVDGKFVKVREVARG